MFKYNFDVSQQDVSSNYEVKHHNDKLIIDMVQLFLPNFIRSNEYLLWESNNHITDDILSRNLKNLMEQKYDDLESNFTEHDKLCSHPSLHYVNPRCLIEVKESPYLFNFLRAVENLPIGVTLCKAFKRSSSDVYHFPIVYINKMYGVMTGYNRIDVLGSKFLDFNKPVSVDDKTSDHELFDHLQDAKPFMTILNSSSKKNQDDVTRQLIGVKPVLDCYRRYSFVIGIHMDVTNENNMYWSNKLMYNLLLKIPRKLNVIEFPTSR